MSWQQSCRCQFFSCVPLATKLVFPLLAAILLLGCARQPNAPRPSAEANDTREDQPKLPFDQSPDKNGIFPSSSILPVARNVPAGTTLTVRLASSLSSATAHRGDAFRAVLDEPVLVQGESAVPPGTPVTGEVVAVNAVASLHAPAYVRLQLTAITVDGKAVPIQSSSMFVKAGPGQTRDANRKRRQDESGLPASPGKISSPASKKVQFEAGLRLTFRLTAPMSLPR